MANANVVTIALHDISPLTILKGLLQFNNWGGTDDLVACTSRIFDTIDAGPQVYTDKDTDIVVILNWDKNRMILMENVN